MHELSLTESLLALALRRAEAAGARRVAGVTVQIGALAGIEPDALRGCFAMLTPDTAAAGASLHIEETAARVRCRACGHEYDPTGAGWLCPGCGAPGGDVLAGRECLLRAIEIETRAGEP